MFSVVFLCVCFGSGSVGILFSTTLPSDEIQGKWQIVSIWQWTEGKPEPNEDVGMVKLVKANSSGRYMNFEKDKFTDELGNSIPIISGKKEGRRWIRFDESEGAKNELYSAIYMIDGDRMLMLVHKSGVPPKDFNIMNLKSTYGTLIEFSRSTACKLRDHGALKGKKSDKKPKYVIVDLTKNSNSISTYSGTMSRGLYEKEFNSDYEAAATRFTPTESSVVVGALIVFDARATITLPIHMLEESGSKLFLCQGTTRIGAAPRYSANDAELDGLLKKIKKDLQNVE